MTALNGCINIRNKSNKKAAVRTQRLFLFTQYSLYELACHRLLYGRVPDGNGHAAVGFNTTFLAVALTTTGIEANADATGCAAGATTTAAGAAGLTAGTGLVATGFAGLAAGLATGLVAAFCAGGVTFLQVQPFSQVQQLSWQEQRLSLLVLLF